jgi:hypothetical protein
LGQRFPQLGDCYQQSAPMAYGGNSKRLQIFGGEMAQVFGISGSVTHEGEMYRLDGSDVSRNRGSVV